MEKPSKHIRQKIPEKQKEESEKIQDEKQEKQETTAEGEVKLTHKFWN